MNYCCEALKSHITAPDPLFIKEDKESGRIFLFFEDAATVDLVFCPFCGTKIDSESSSDE